MNIIKTEEDKRLVKYLSKRSKRKKINVYYNKKSSKTGKTNYIQGDYYSEKNKRNFPYKSSYELAYLYQLERDEKVLQYLYEPFELYYKDSEDKKRIYRPDFMVLYTDGSIKITEVKPTIMLKDYDVKAKAASCREFIKDKFKGSEVEYKFITERDLFTGEKEYNDFLKSLK